MGGKVQRVPRGLLGLFGIVGSDPPSTLADEYWPTVNMLELLLAELPIESDSAADPAAVTGSIITLTVPAGQNWWLIGAQSSVTAAAVAVSNVLQVLIGNPTNRSTFAQASLIVGSTLPPVAAAVNTHQCPFAPPRPLLLRAGDVVQGRLQATDAAGVQNLAIACTFRRIFV